MEINFYLKVLFLIILTLGAWGIVVSGSRVSYGGYIVASAFVIAVIALKQKNWIKVLAWFTSRALLFTLFNVIIMTMFGLNLSNRFLKMLESYPIIHTAFHTVNGVRKTIMYESIPTALGLKDTPIGQSALFKNPEELPGYEDPQKSPINKDDQRPIPWDR